MSWKFFNSSGQEIVSDTVADGSITLAKMAANSIDSNQYVDDSIDNVHLADNAVDTAEIAADAVSNAKLANMAANTVKVNATTGSANPTDISMASANLSGAIADGDVLLVYDASTTSLKTVAKSVLVSGLGGAALTGSTNNTIVTVTGADAMQGESNLTFDGSHLSVHDPDGGEDDQDVNTSNKIVQKVTNTRNVGGSATNIHQSQDTANIIFVMGMSESPDTNRFVDIVAFGGGGSVPVISSSTVRGSPASRSYNISGLNLTLVMSTGTYNIMTTGWGAPPSIG